jgi:hypothetical protein
MNNAWDQARGLTDKHSKAGGIFVRLTNDGDKVTGVFCGDPQPREVIWLGDKYEPYDANNPAHRATGKRPTLKVAINFFVPADNAMKVIEGGTQWFKDVLKVRTKYGLDKWLFEIERHGDAGDTKTSYTILPEEKIDPGMRARIDAVELHDLAAIGANSGEHAKGHGTGAGREINPFE